MSRPRPVRSASFPPARNQQFQYGVQVRGRLTEPSEFENIIIRAQPDGSFIRLRDLARIELGAKEYTFDVKYNGRDATAFSVNLTPDANAIETSGLIHAELEQLAKRFPADIAYDFVIDNTIFVVASLEEVVKTFFEALLLVLIVVFVFLQSWRATLIPMLAVPVSLIATFGAFTLLGFSINTLTLFGMILAIGIVVDDAIVVVEAVEYHMHHGSLDGPRRDAEGDGGGVGAGCGHRPGVVGGVCAGGLSRRHRRRDVQTVCHHRGRLRRSLLFCRPVPDPGPLRPDAAAEHRGHRPRSGCPLLPIVQQGL